jgi:hypothetical protein
MVAGLLGCSCGVAVLSHNSLCVGALVVRIAAVLRGWDFKRQGPVGGP